MDFLVFHRKAKKKKRREASNIQNKQMTIHAKSSHWINSQWVIIFTVWLFVTNKFWCITCARKFTVVSVTLICFIAASVRGFTANYYEYKYLRRKKNFQINGPHRLTMTDSVNKHKWQQMKLSRFDKLIISWHWVSMLFYESYFIQFSQNIFFLWFFFHIKFNNGSNESRVCSN